MEFEDMDPMFNGDDLEEFERNQLANDRALELNDETPLGHAIDETGELID